MKFNIPDKEKTENKKKIKKNYKLIFFREHRC